MTRKLLLVLVVCLALAPAPPKPEGLPPGMERALFLAGLQGETEVTLLALLEPGAFDRVARAVRAAGGSIAGAAEAGDFAVIRLATAAAGDLLRRWRSLGLVEVALDRPLGAATAGAAPSLERAAARTAMEVNLAAIRADAFRTATGSAGRGVTIAVIDTGVDPSHPDLQLTSGWESKLVDWVDFTGEGDVAVTVTVRSARGGWAETPLGRVNLGSIPSRSGRYRLGVLNEAQLAPGGPLGRDLNRNGIPGESILVLVTDSQLPGVYDTVYVDTNGNRDFTDEVALREFRRGFQYAAFAGRPEAGREERVPFVVTRIAGSGDQVNLGFDANGHGTHVAGVAAAFGGHRGGVNGVAPGARIMVLKALGAAGDGYWSDIALAMLHAAEHGAEVVLLSLTGNHDPGALQTETELMRRLAERHGVLFVVAAGNQGPGLGTFNAPGDPSLTVSVGAYMDPALWQVHHGYKVPGEGPLPFSASGPRPDGGLGPSTLAPGAAAGPVPLWQARSGYALLEGTSQAVPHLGGMIALILEEARAAGIPATPVSLRRAVEAGSRSLAGVPPVRQGHGVAEAPRVWTALVRGNAPGWSAAAADPGVNGAGLFFRGSEAATAAIRVTNPAAREQRLAVTGPSWVTTDRWQLSLPPGSSRLLELGFTPSSPGLYSGLLVLAGGPGEVRFPVTAVVPHRFPDGLGTLSLAGDLPAAGLSHHYLLVPAGTNRLEVTFSVDAGQARLHLFRPDGKELWVTGQVGRAGGQGPERVVRAVHWPEPGVWELVVAGSPAVSLLGLEGSRFRMEVTAGGILAEPSPLVITAAHRHRAGTDLRAEVTLRNHHGPVTARATGFGLTAAGGLGAPALQSIRAGSSVSAGLPPVAPGAVYLQVGVANAADPGADLSLFLYHRAPASARWTEVALAATPGQAEEVIRIFAPPPGDYVVYVEGRGFPGETTFELRYLLVGDAGQVGVISPGRRWERGEAWTLPVHVLDPGRPGEHHGLVLVQDQAGHVLAAVPVELTLGRPELAIEFQSPPLVTGRAERVLIRVREAASGRLVGTVVTINGRQYSAPRGEVVYPVIPGRGPDALVVTVRDPHYQPAMVTLRLVPGPAAAALPPWTGEDLEPYRRKVRAFLLGP